MPIISAIIGLGSSVGIIALLTYIFDIPNFTLTLAVMIGLVLVLTTHSLFYLDLKNLRKRCRYCRSYRNSGYKEVVFVIFAGLTVMIAVCGLSLVGIDFLAVMGFA